MNYFVTAIGTDSGKTFVSAIILEATQADYWKPIQAGHPTDSETINRLISNNYPMVLQPAYTLKTAASPHAAAKIDGITIDINNINIPDRQNDNDLVIEGAGGLMVPLNESGLFVVDLISRFDAEIVLVSNNYLGSINHTLLTINEIKRRGLKVKGIVFNGPRNDETENFILNYSGYKCLLKIEHEEKVDEYSVKKYAMQLVANWFA